MNREQLHEFIAQSTRNESNICQITALRDGKTEYEDCWKGSSTDDAVHVASVTKSVMSLLTGIAIDKGLIKSIDEWQLFIDKCVCRWFIDFCNNSCFIYCFLSQLP